MEKKIGKLIREIRLKNNLTQEEFAKKFFVDKKTIGNYENNRRMPDIVFLQKISTLFNVSMDCFRGDEKIKSNSEDLTVVEKNGKLAIFDKAQNIFLTPHIYDRILLSKTQPHSVQKCEDIIDDCGVLHKNGGLAYYAALVDNYGNIQECPDVEYFITPFEDGVAVVSNKKTSKKHLIDSNGNILSKGYDVIYKSMLTVSGVIDVGLYQGVEYCQDEKDFAGEIKRRLLLSKYGEELDLTLETWNSNEIYVSEFENLDRLFACMLVHDMRLIELAPPKIFFECENYIKIVNEVVKFSERFKEDADKKEMIEYVLKFLEKKVELYKPELTEIICVEIPQLHFKSGIYKSYIRKSIERLYIKVLNYLSFAVSYDKKSLKEVDTTGNFLFKKDDRYYFYEKYANAIFINSAKKRKEEKSDLFLEIEKFLLNLCDVCGTIKYKPSLMLLNTVVDPDSIIEKLGNDYYDIIDEEEINFLNEKTSVFMAYSGQNYHSILQQVFEKRNNPTNDLIIFIDDIEETKLKDLHIFLTLAKSRRVYFILVANDLEHEFWNNNLLETIKFNSEIQYTCDNNKIKEILYGFSKSAFPNMLNLE